MFEYAIMDRGQAGELPAIHFHLSLRVCLRDTCRYKQVNYFPLTVFNFCMSCGINSNVRNSVTLPIIQSILVAMTALSKELLPYYTFRGLEASLENIDLLLPFWVCLGNTGMSFSCMADRVVVWPPVMT